MTLKLAKLDGKPEIFHTLQGEGGHIGVASVFVRLSMCNLDCGWCDTDYTWNRAKYNLSEQMMQLDPYEVMDEIRKFDCTNIVITGGEPMLQQGAILKLMDIRPSFRYEIETNGTILPSTCFNALITQYNVSPKLKNSGVCQQRREKPEVIKYFADNPKAIFKFVVDKPEDVLEANDFVQRYNIYGAYLMPQATTRGELREKSPWLSEECKKFGFNFSTRLHVELWDSKRGV